MSDTKEKLAEPVGNQVTMMTNQSSIIRNTKKTLDDVCARVNLLSELMARLVEVPEAETQAAVKEPVVTEDASQEEETVEEIEEEKGDE